MLELLSYIAADTKCSLAIQGFNNKSSVDEWIWINTSLYNSISINVDGLPSIASCNFQGQHYPNISEFHELFRKSLNEIDDNFYESH